MDPDGPEGPTTLTTANEDEEIAVKDWCACDHVNLPYDSCHALMGWISPLNDNGLIELKAHVESGHTAKSNLCKGCLEAEGPRKTHRTVRDVDKASHVLHIDIAGPSLSSDDGYSYFLVGALRLPGFPLLIDVRLLTSRTSVCDQLERMIAYFESLQFEGFPIGETCRIKRLHSDRAGELTAPHFERFLSNHKSIYHTLTTGYDPQANGTAEKVSGTHQVLSGKSPSSSGLDPSYWSYAVRYAAQSLICSALQ